MTIVRMAASYRQSAGLLYLRIVALRDQSRTASPAERAKLESRISALRRLYRDTQETALMLERYYDRRNEDD